MGVALCQMALTPVCSAPTTSALGQTQIDLGIALAGCWRGHEDLYVALAEPSQHLWRRGNGDGDSAEGALTGADDIRVPDVRVTIADDEAGDASRIGRAQDGPQIPGFLKPFGDQIERQTGHRESGQGLPQAGRQRPGRHRGCRHSQFCGTPPR